MLWWQFELTYNIYINLDLESLRQALLKEMVMDLRLRIILKENQFKIREGPSKNFGIVHKCRLA